MNLDAAAALALRLMQEHGLNDWTLVFDRAKTRAGVCRFESKEIGLSQPLTRLHADDEVRDTILHEIAHALVGPDHGHDPVWEAKARAIGSSGTRCISSVAGSLPGAWVGTCPSGHTLERHRQPERVLTCGICSPSFDVRVAYRWTFRGGPADMHPVYVAELALLQGWCEDDDAVPAPGMLIPHQSIRPVLPVGTPVVIQDSGPLAGQTGRVFKCGRTRYHVLTAHGVISIHAPSVRPRRLGTQSMGAAVPDGAGAANSLEENVGQG